MTPREILNKLKWTDNPLLENIKIWFIHRGAPDNLKMINGTEIIAMEHFSFIIERDDGKQARIPYHRIKTITYNEAIIFSR